MPGTPGTTVGPETVRAGSGPRPGRRARLVPPLWRAAPRRLLHDRLAFLLVVGVLALVGASAAAGPLYAEAVSDASLTTVLEAVPDGASAKEAPVVRLNGGVDPTGAGWADLLTGLATIPGLGPPRVTAQSVSTELHPKIFYDPVGPVVSSGPGATVPVRTFGIDDPAARLVVTGRADVTGGVWLPDPVAADLRAEPGDELTVGLMGLPGTGTTTTRVAGTYAVEEDGRTPRQPVGQRLWSDLATEGFPADAESSTLRAHLLVTDTRTAGTLARATGDELLWSALSRLHPERPRLEQLHATADGTADLRHDLATSPEANDLRLALRPAVVSGIEDLTRRADALTDTARRGAEAATRTGLALSLALVVAVAGYATTRRRREVLLAAGTGRSPWSSGLLHVAELLPAAAVGGSLGWVLARVLVTGTVGSGPPSRATLESSVLWCVAATLAALVVAGAVVAAATAAESRRLRGRERVHLPWVAVLVAVAAATTVGLVSRPRSAGEPLGPLDLLVPPLVVAAVAAVGSTAGYAVLRRVRPGRPPRRGASVAGWLAGRRLRAPDAARTTGTALAATGLAMLVFSVAALASLEATVADRAATEVGADTVYALPSSWSVDPDAPVAAKEPDDGSPLEVDEIPVGRPPPVPAGQAVVWRADTTLAGSAERVRLLVVDPASFDAAAGWGTPDGPVADGRPTLTRLAAENDPAAQDVPALLVGSAGELDLEPEDRVTVETTTLPVAVRVAALLPAFPGTGAGTATLVVPEDGFFRALGNHDPRLRPRPDAPRNVLVEFLPQLWSSTSAAGAATLATHGVPQDVVGTLAEAEALPVRVAATQARRYELGLGAVFGLLGLAAVVLGAVRLARRSPAADRMLELAGAGRTAAAVARGIEVAVGLVVTAVLAALALLALRPLGGVLLEPGDALPPPATLDLPPTALAVGAVWLSVAGLASWAAGALARSSQPTVEVLRGED
jgi:hypothetical protein